MIAYRILITFILPFVFVQTVVQALRCTCLRYAMQRLGVGYGSSDNNDSPLWFHCASIGETNAVLPLIQRWLELHPDDTAVLTTNTVTAARVVKKHLGRRLRHYYLPLDYPMFCRSFLQKIRPRCALFAESEIWLNLFIACERRNIPIIILNGRLSDKMQKLNALVRKYYRIALGKAAWIYTRSESDSKRYRKLGAKSDRVRCLGNLKYAVQFPPHLPNLINRRYFLAASTHPTEEVSIVGAAAAAAPQTLLVIVPRHPERGADIAKQLSKLGCAVQLRSRQPVLDNRTSVYIADTVGELPALICHAALVFMGGSLVNHGGQNVLEPAMLKTPQITGPHTHNFRDEAAGLKAAGGLREVADETALAQALSDFDADPQTYITMADKAYDYVQTHTQVLERYLQVLECPPQRR